MSRRSKAKKNDPLLRSHPAESYPEHRQFLIRSMERNDCELAALIDLNRSLHTVKRAILQECGEDVLLNLGDGSIVLKGDADELVITTTTAPDDGDDTTVALPPTDEGQHLCVDFLLRMKLRTRLLNRLIRRLHRIAHAMDGNDINPPGTPKYGDLRLHIDDAKVQEFVHQLAERQTAIATVLAAREENRVVVPAIVEEEENVVPKQEESTVEQETVKREGKEEKTNTDGDVKMEEAEEKDQAKEDVKDPERSISASETKPEEAPKSAEDSNKEEAKEAAPVATTSQEEDPLESSYEILRDHKAVYDRIIDPATGQVHYPILDQPHQEDYVAIKFGGGVGAINRQMTTAEMEFEYKRWRTTLLSRIPDQPTFAEIGTKHRVFYLEDRRKRLLEGDDNKESSPKKKAKSEGDMEEKEDADSNEVGDKQDGDDETEKEGADAEEKEKEDSAKEETDDNEAGTDYVKPISLIAVPSFHEQDLRRTKLVHADLMATSIYDNARRRLEEATREYNTALARSNQYYDRLVSMKTQIHALHRTSHGDFHAQYAVARNQYLKKRLAFDAQKMNKLLPSRFGHAATGTHMTQRFGSRDPISNEVASALADVVDAVENIAQGRVQNEVFTERFVAPAMSNQAREAALRQEYSTCNEKLRASEDERSRSWKKMLKVKAEAEGPQRSDRLQNMPVPPLRTSTSQSVPRQVARQEFAMYTPVSPPRYQSVLAQTHYSAAGGQSESKYSAARVKQRISSDGTVAPVSMPKQGSDGLYQRPAGRTRKGMEWDAVRGIWVPSQHRG